jgi:hypothetical protein
MKNKKISRAVAWVKQEAAYLFGIEDRGPIKPESRLSATQSLLSHPYEHFLESKARTSTGRKSVDPTSCTEIRPTLFYA